MGSDAQIGHRARSPLENHDTDGLSVGCDPDFKLVAKARYERLVHRDLAGNGSPRRASARNLCRYANS